MNKNRNKATTKARSNKNYVCVCDDLNVLLQESNLLECEFEIVKFIPQVNDLALVNNVEYKFNGTEWIENEK